MFFRFLVWVILGYLVYKVFKDLFTTQDKGETNVKGKNRNSPLDLSDTEVDDAHFEDIGDEDEQA